MSVIYLPNLIVSPYLQEQIIIKLEGKLRQRGFKNSLTGEVDIFKDYTNIFEKELIIQALKYTKGRKVEAAKLLGIGRNTITRKIKELEIRIS